MFKKFKFKIWDEYGKPIEKGKGTAEEIEKDFRRFKKNKLGF